MTSTEHRIISPDVMAEFRSRGDKPEFWASQWRDVDYDRYLERYQKGYLAQFETVFTRHLPKTSRIVEAGCGRAQYVVALRQRGYDAVGLDFAAGLVEAIRKARPTLPVDLGDVRDLPYQDETFGAYISLGVVEHFWDESAKILEEAHRVLQRGGTILASVPHFSPRWRKWALREMAPYEDRSRPVAGEFYQFYFTQDEFVRRIRTAGFEPIEIFYYDALYGAKRAFPLFDRLYESAYLIRGTFESLVQIAGSAMAAGEIRAYGHGDRAEAVNPDKPDFRPPVEERK